MTTVGTQHQLFSVSTYVMPLDVDYHALDSIVEYLDATTTTCAGCGDVYGKDAIETHQNTCEKWNVTCPYCASTRGMDKIDRHKRTCEYRPRATVLHTMLTHEYTQMQHSVILHMCARSCAQHTVDLLDESKNTNAINHPWYPRWRNLPAIEWLFHEMFSIFHMQRVFDNNIYNVLIVSYIYQHYLSTCELWLGPETKTRDNIQKTVRSPVLTLYLLIVSCAKFVNDRIWLPQHYHYVFYEKYAKKIARELTDAGEDHPTTSWGYAWKFGLSLGVFANCEKKWYVRQELATLDALNFFYEVIPGKPVIPETSVLAEYTKSMFEKLRPLLVERQAFANCRKLLKHPRFADDNLVDDRVYLPLPHQIFIVHIPRKTHVITKRR